MTWACPIIAGVVVALIHFIWLWKYRGLASDYLALDELRDKEIKALKASNQRLVSVSSAQASRLIRIVGLETAGAASIGKRMAKIARGEA